MPEEKLLNQAAPGPNAEASAEEPASRDNTDQRSSAERRSSTRYPVSASAEVVEPRSRTRLTGRATDLGPGGCYIDTVSPLPVGTVVHIRLASEGRMLQAQARVLYATPGMGMGLAFTKIDPKCVASLADWLRELSGELMPEPVPDNEIFFDFQTQSESKAAISLREILTELVTLLARKNVLTKSEAVELRKKLSDDPA